MVGLTMKGDRRARRRVFQLLRTVLGISVEEVSAALEAAGVPYSLGTVRNFEQGKPVNSDTYEVLMGMIPEWQVRARPLLGMVDEDTSNAIEDED